MIRKILQKPDPALLRRSRAVDPTDDVRALISDLLDTRARWHAAGLSAVQVGEHLRLFVINPSFADGFYVMINPEIIRRGSRVDEDSEGCHSIDAGVTRFRVKRHEVVTVRFLDRDRNPRELVLKRFGARVVQHEIDHLDGKLIA